MAKLAQDVGADRHHGLVAGRVEHGLVAGLGGVVLHVGAVDDDLDDAVPDLQGGKERCERVRVSLGEQIK